MPYLLVGEFPCDSQKFIPDHIFNTNSLVLLADFPDAPEAWNKAANIFQFVNIPEIGNTYTPRKLYLPLNKPTELIFYQSSVGYQIQIDFPYWISPSNIILKIWESSMPTFSENLPVAPSNEFANKLSTSLAISTTISNIAANPLRKGFKVRNRGANTVYLGYNDPALTINTAAFGIPPGDVYEETSDSWTGILHFVTQSGTTNLVVTEFMT
jgi:hypothetical protein